MRKFSCVLFILDHVLQVTEARRQRISAAALLRRLPIVSSLHRAVLSAVSFPVSPCPGPALQHTHLLSPSPP